MIRGAGAGIAYFGLVFLLGMILGTIRILLLEPWVGEVTAVLIELPVMLAGSWIACGRLIGRFGVPPRPGSRLVMGGLAFLLLVAAELWLSLFAVGGTVAEHFRSYLEADHLLGLLGQLVFASFPLLSLRGASAATVR